MTPELAIGILSWIVNTGFLLLVTFLLHRFFRTNRASLNLLTFLFLFLFSVTSFMLLVGLAGGLQPIPILTVSVIGTLVLLLPNRIRQELLTLPKASKDSAQILGLVWRSLPVWLRILTIFAFFVSLARFAFLIWALPPFVWDSLTYHLTNVAHWTQTGRIELFETPMTRIFTPANYETLASWFTVFIHHDFIVEAAGLPAYFLAILAVYAGVRGLGISRVSAWIAAMTYGSLPALLLATTGTKNDPHVAAYYLTALAIVIDLYGRAETSEARNPLGQLVTLSLVLFLAAGTKAYIAHILPGLLFIAIAGAYFRGNLGVWTRHFKFAWKQFRESSGWFKFTVISLLLVGLFIGGYWNVRNWVLTGNPFYPYGVEIGPESVVEGAERDAQVSLDRLEQNLLSVIDKFGDRNGRISPDIPNSTGWGWFVYGIGLISVIWALLQKGGFRIIFCGFLLSLLLIFTTTRPSPWNMRYIVWFPALFSFAFAFLFDWFMDLEKRWLWILVGLTVITLGLNFLMTLNYGVIPRSEFRNMIDLPVGDRDSARFRFRVPEEYESAIELMPRDELLGYNVHTNGFIYPWYRADFSQSLVYIPIEESSSCQDIADAMRLRRTRYVSVAPEQTDDSIIALLRDCAVEADLLRERGLDLYVISE
jgi:hypothetical protein